MPRCQQLRVPPCRLLSDLEHQRRKASGPCQQNEIKHFRQHRGRFYTRLSQRVLFRLPSRPVNVRVGPFVLVPEDFGGATRLLTGLKTVERNGARLAVMLHPLLPRRPATATHDRKSAFAGVLNQWTLHRYHGSSKSPRTQRCARLTLALGKKSRNYNGRDHATTHCFFPSL